MVSLGRKSWLFFGSDHGGERVALMYSLIGTCKLNGVDPESYLRHVLDVIAEQSTGSGSAGKTIFGATLIRFKKTRNKNGSYSHASVSYTMNLAVFNWLKICIFYRKYLNAKILAINT